MVDVVQLFFQCLSWPLPAIAQETSQLVCQGSLCVPTRKRLFQVGGHISSYDEFGAGNMQGLAKALWYLPLSWVALLLKVSFGSVGHVGDVKHRRCGKLAFVARA